MRQRENIQIDQVGLGTRTLVGVRKSCVLADQSRDLKHEGGSRGRPLKEFLRHREMLLDHLKFLHETPEPELVRTGQFKQFVLPGPEVLVACSKAVKIGKRETQSSQLPTGVLRPSAPFLATLRQPIEVGHQHKATLECVEQ